MAFIYNLTDSWTDAATTWNGIKLAVTNTASSASSNLLNLTVTGATTASFVVDKSGNLALNGTVNKITFTAPATGATLTLADNSTFVTSGAYSSTFTFTGATTLTFPTSGTVTALGNSTTGSGAIVLASSPTLVTPNLGTPSSATLTNATGLPISTGVSGLGTGVSTALAVNVGSAGALVTFDGALGTPASGNLSNCTGYPAGSITGLGAGVATWLATPSSANLAAAVTDETGSGSLVFATSPTLVTPALGTPSSATLTNATGLPISTGVSGLGTGVATFLATPSSANLASAVTDETGSGALVFGTSPTIGSPTITGTATFNGSTSGTVAFKAPAIAGTTTFTLPAGNGTSGYVLVTDGLGNTSWAVSGGAAGNAAGLNKNVQFNDGGNMAGNAAFNFDKATANLALGIASTTTGSLSFYNSASANATTIQGGNASSAVTYTLPTAAPASNGYILSSTTGGTLSWANPTALGVDLDVGTTAITGGTSGRILYDNAGVLGELATTGTGNVVLATSPTLVTPALGTPTSGDFSTGTFTWPTFNQNTSGTAAGLSSTLAVASGGTGLTSGTSGGVLYYSATGTLASSAALTASALVIGGGAGVAPSTTTTGTGILTFLGTPSSANLAAAVTDETGTGSLVFSNSPTFNDDITLGVASTATGAAKFVGSTSGLVTLSVADAAGTWTMKLPTTAGTNGNVLVTDGSGNTSWSGAGTGDVVGPASATNNAIVRFDTTTGKLVQDSAVTIADTTGDISTPGTLVMGSSFKRNRLINGNMYIAQRATSATVTAGTAVPTASTGYPCVDRWFVYSTGANVTAAQVAGSGSNRSVLRITGAASVTAVGIGQRIEQLNSFDMAGQTATLSVELANSLLTTVTWTASYATTDDTFGTIGTPTKTQIATGTFTVNSTLTRYTTNISIPAAATTGIEILFTVGAQTSGTWDVDNVQLEVGSVATPYERQIYSDQLVQCQRYYQITAQLSGATPSATTVNAWGTISPTMRVAPTLGQTGVLNFQGDGTNNANQSATGLGSNFSTAYAILLLGVPNFAGFTTSRPGTLAVPGSNSNYITMSAEL
jgi:hypothetical protein